MMETILYLYKKSKALIAMGMPMSVLKKIRSLIRSFLLNMMCQMTVWTCLMIIRNRLTRSMSMCWSATHKEDLKWQLNI